MGRTDATQRGTRPGGRSADVRARVLAAAADELLDRGFDAFALTRVAERAGVHHTTVYRRWPTKSALVLAAVTDLARAYAPAPATGQLRSDLVEYFGGLSKAFGDPRTAALIRGLVAIKPDEFVQERREYWAARIAVTQEIFAAAAARGEAVAPSDQARLLELIAGPIWMRALVSDLPIDAGVVASFVDSALRAIGFTEPAAPS